MKWEGKDIDQYVQAKEYVDTAVVPLVPISFSEQMKQVVSKGEFVLTLANELERQLKGRILLLPPYTYLKNEEENKDKELKKWKATIKPHFKHVIFLTSDEDWKREGEDDIVWVPTVPLEHMDADLKRKLLQDQIEQILNILLQSWNKS
ncbi:YpiF family protein [Bacillus sp. FJAT-47783]|uniref:YpiF family protein n=1 Tax=Bacillus sp. FJAT-47783 TaxID=2922712 RepID=UPI001FAD18AF|nr:YpiF family protein [Bacillus sp. FJAT-47783]